MIINGNSTKNQDTFSYPEVHIRFNTNTQIMTCNTYPIIADPVDCIAINRMNAINDSIRYTYAGLHSAIPPIFMFF